MDRDRLPLFDPDIFGIVGVNLDEAERFVLLQLVELGGFGAAVPLVSGAAGEEEKRIIFVQLLRMRCRYPPSSPGYNRPRRFSCTPYFVSHAP